jgi:hypothetical protein
MENPNQSNDGDSASGSLWGIANGSGLGLHGGPTGGGMMSPPPSWNPQLGEMMLKVDTKLKVGHPDFFLLPLLVASAYA